MFLFVPSEFQASQKMSPSGPEIPERPGPTALGYNCLLEVVEMWDVGCGMGGWIIHLGIQVLIV